MSKKVTLMLLVLIVAAGGLFAQNEEKAKNAVAVQFGFIGVEASYERMFNRHFSVLGDMSYTYLILADEFTLSAKGRVYPFGGAFYLELGLGYAYGHSLSDRMGDLVLSVLTFGWWLTQIDKDRLAPNGGFLIQPALGWKIDIGKKDHFVLPISLGLDFKLIKIDDSGKLPDALPYLRIGVGYAF